MKKTVFGYTGTENTCVCCGESIPEGRQVCISCEKKSLPRDKSETLTIGYDSSNGEDLAELSVVKWSGGKIAYINTFVGKEAEDMYEQLTSFGHHVKL